MKKRKSTTSALPVLLTLVVLAAGCQGEGEKGDREAVGAPVVEEVRQEKPDMSESREAFGMPLPPEVTSVRRDAQRVRVTTRMKMDDLQAFFESRLVDYEVFRVGNRLEMIPLRPHSPRAVARYFTDYRSHIIVEYRPAPDLAELERARIPGVEPEGEQEASGEQAPTVRVVTRERERPKSHANEPSWLEDLRGRPVELRTETGELLAPGAVWGEPYVPPEGSPLHTRRNRHNFGRPFGDWIAH